METRQVDYPPAFLVVIVLLLLGLDSHFCLEYTATHVRVPNECDFLTCEEGPHVKKISNEAREPPRQRLGRYKYLAPADNVKTVILIEQCYAVCFDRYLPQDSNGIGKEYVLPNTATLSCMDNMEVFLCIATCAFHVNSKLPGYKANFTSTSYTDIYSPKKEIEFQLDRLTKSLELKEIEAFFNPVGTNSTIIALKGNIAKLEGIMPMSAECKSFCNVTEYGICDTAFEGNEQNEKCKETCNSYYDLCSEMCDIGKNISHALASQAETLLLTLTPEGPPHFHLKHDPRRQEVYPAAFYNISGTKPHSLDGPVGLVWKVQNVSVTSYYPFNFQHPFIGEVDRSDHQPDLYHLYTQNNHSGIGGYLNIIEFCKAANVSFAIVTKRGVSSFSPPSEVCFPGVYYPSPPISMSLNAEYDDGKLILNISLERSIDQSLIDAYELEAYLGNESNIAARNSELFKHTFLPNQSLVLTILGRDGIKDYNLYSIWDREIVFKTSVLPKPKKARQKETSFVYHLKEPQLHSPGIEYTKHFEFDNITGLLNLIVELQLITDIWNSSAETFVNYSTYSIHYMNETIASLDVFPNEPVAFSRLPPLMKEHYKLNVRHSCCLMANTRYKDRFKIHSEVLETKPIPSRLSNLTANFDIMNASIVVATIEWTSSEEPYGISEFQIVISHVDISVLVADDTVKILDNDTVQPLQKFNWKVTFPLGTGGTFNISVHAISRWNTASESITTATAIYVPTTATQGSTGIPIYVWFIVVIIVVIIVSLFAIVIGMYIWYYRSNKVVVIPTSTLFVENNIFDNAEAQDQEFMPLPAMDSWEIRPQDIIVLGQLGEGNFGEVFRGLLKSRLDSPSALREDDPNRHLVVAVKLLKCDATAALKCEFFKEIDLMKKISSGSCAYIVNMVGCSTHEEPIALVLEYASNGDLLKYLRAMRKLSRDSHTEGHHTNENHYVNGPKMSEDVDHTDDPCESDTGKNAKSWGDYRQLGELTPANLISFGWQIASGMKYLSTMHIVHRDLASRNILVCDNKQLKISDFGLAREDDCYVKTTEGKLPLRWMAIESIQERVFTTKSDVWSFGVVLWEIATLGGHPYPALGNRGILAYLLRGMRLEKPRNCSEQWYKLTKLCWEMNPEDRPHFAELRIKLGEMLDDVHHDHYIDLTVDEDMPYYRMQPADVEGDENDEVIQSFLKDDDSSYPEPSELLETSSAKHMEMILNTRQPSESSDTSASQSQEDNM